MCQNAFGQSDCRILQSAISQEKSERPSRFFVCKLTPNFLQGNAKKKRHAKKYLK